LLKDEPSAQMPWTNTMLVLLDIFRSCHGLVGRRSRLIASAVVHRCAKGATIALADDPLWTASPPDEAVFLRRRAALVR
jgi:hypothetical protein